MIPKLSIITINLNNVEGLKKTMKSVFEQSATDFEYIVIDGGSQDGSLDTIQDFEKRKGPKYINQRFIWISEADNGIYHAMNKGIKIARGEYCQFLNSGDWLVKYDVTEKMLSTMSDCSIFYGNMLKISSNGKIFTDTCGAGELTMLSFYLGGMNHSPTYIKRELFEKYGLYDENYKIVSDWKWFLNVICMKNESYKYINLDVAYFDMTGISSTNKELDSQERHKVLSEMIPQCIIKDYDLYFKKIDQMCRINRYKIPNYIFKITERILYKFEKCLLKTSKKEYQSEFIH